MHTHSLPIVFVIIVVSVYFAISANVLSSSLSKFLINEYLSYLFRSNDRYTPSANIPNLLDWLLHPPYVYVQ